LELLLNSRSGSCRSIFLAKPTPHGLRKPL
jgi:hypothetical protein